MGWENMSLKKAGADKVEAIGVDKNEKFEKEKVEKFTAYFMDAVRGMQGGLLNALLDDANKEQAKKRGHWEKGEKVMPRKVGNNFDETFSEGTIDGVDGRIETINLTEAEKAFVITDIHGDENSFTNVLQQTIQAAMEGDNKTHLISLGDWAVMEMEGSAQSVEPLKAFLAIEALKKTNLDQIDTPNENESQKTLSDYLVNNLKKSGLSDSEVASIIKSIQEKVETHCVTGNAEYILTPTKQLGDQLPRKDKVMGLQKAEMFLKSLPSVLMMRANGKDIVMSHFLPPLATKNDWDNSGMAAINSENISDLRIRAGISGGFDKKIDAEKKSNEWSIGKLNIAKEYGAYNIIGNNYKPTSHGLLTFNRILEKKGQNNKGAYIFGHESNLVPSGINYLQGEEGKEDEIICFHTGGGKKVSDKIMLKISDNGDIEKTKVG